MTGQYKPSPLAPLNALWEMLHAAPPEERIRTLDRVHQEIERLLQTILTSRNEVAALHVCRFIKELPYDAYFLVNELSDSENANLRSMYETAQTVLLELIFAERTLTNTWRQFTLPVPNASDFLHSLAGNLRVTGSERLLGAEDALDCDSLAGQDIATQAKILGRHFAQTDAAAPFDLERVQQLADRHLMPLVFSWGMSVYMTSPRSALIPMVAENIRNFQDAFAKLVGNPPPRMLLPSHPNFLNALFRAPYIHNSVREFSELVSREILAPFVDHYVDKNVSTGKKRKRTEPYRVGIFARHWNSLHPVHRCLSPMIHHLAEGNFQLYWYLPYFTQQENSADLSHTGSPHVLRRFSLGASITKEGMNEIYRTIREDRLDLLFYPEVGMAKEVSLMARTRLARVQAVGYGHPLTTGSPQMDYFLGGAAVESTESYREYTERLVLIPGMGVCSTEPPAPLPRRRPIDAVPVRLMNVSSGHKHNADLMSAWAEILNRTEVPVELHLFPSLKNANAKTFTDGIRHYTDAKSVIVHTKCSRDELMEHLADGDIYLESFPFGGYNTLVEALSTGMPAVTLLGKTAPTRFGPAIIRLMDLPEWLIAKDREAYIEAALRLIADTQERLRIRERLSREAVLEALCQGNEPQDFAAAIEWMIERGPLREGSSRRPVVIKAGHNPCILE